MAFSKRQKTDLCTAEFEMNSMKKTVNQHKSELKQLGTVAMNDLKNLKEEAALHLSIIKKEQSENELFREQFLSLKQFFSSCDRNFVNVIFRFHVVTAVRIVVSRLLVAGSDRAVLTETRGV